MIVPEAPATRCVGAISDAGEQRSAPSFARRNWASAADGPRDAESNQPERSIRRYAGHIPPHRNSPSSEAGISRRFRAPRMGIRKPRDRFPDLARMAFFAGDDVSDRADEDGATFATRRGSQRAGFSGGRRFAPRILGAARGRVGLSPAKRTILRRAVAHLFRRPVPTTPTCPDDRAGGSPDAFRTGVPPQRVSPHRVLAVRGFRFRRDPALGSRCHPFRRGARASATGSGPRIDAGYRPCSLARRITTAVADRSEVRIFAQLCRQRSASEYQPHPRRTGAPLGRARDLDRDARAT